MYMVNSSMKSKYLDYYDNLIVIMRYRVKYASCMIFKETCFSCSTVSHLLFPRPNIKDAVQTWLVPLEFVANVS